MRELSLVKKINKNALLLQEISYNYCQKHVEFSTGEARSDMRVINELAHKCIKLSEKLDSSLRYRKNQGVSPQNS